MRCLRQFFFRLQSLLWRRKIEAELTDEIQTHLEMATETNIAAGMSPEDARYAARRQFGGVDQIKEYYRDERGFVWLDQLAGDCRLAVRSLLRAPGFTATAIVVLALGIGVNTAIFSVVRAAFYSARPFPDPEQVVQLYTQDKKNPTDYRLFSYPTYRELRDHGGPFSGILAHNLSMVGVGDGPDSRRTFAGIISANYFEVLGVKLVRGRAFTLAEEAPGSAAPVVIASHLYWKKTGFDPSLVGSTLRVNERPFTVIGIAPENFTGTRMLFGSELYFPLGMFDQLTNDFRNEAKRTLGRRDAYDLFVVGRLKSGVGLEAATSALSAYASNLEEAFPAEQKDKTITLGKLPRLSNGRSPDDEDGLSAVGFLLLGMTGIVLLVASLNLANMFLARGSARRKELAIRLALGGGRGRIIRQLLTEGLVLSLAGGLVGFVLAIWSTDLLVGSLAVLVPISILFSGTANPVVLAATLGFCALSTLFFALGPAIKLSRADVVTDLKDQAGEDAARRHRWLPRNPLVVAQLALSLGLLACAGLFVRSALKSARGDIGFKADPTLLVEADASLGGYDETRSLQLYRRIGDSLAVQPGVRSVSIAATVPFGLINISRPIQRAGVGMAGPAAATKSVAFETGWNSVGADYFSTLGLPLLRGRPFTKAEAENGSGPRVAIIDETLARKLWPGGDALGQCIQYADRDAKLGRRDAGAGARAEGSFAAQEEGAQEIEIIGIVPPVRTTPFSNEPVAAIYVPFAQGFQSAVNFHVRTTADTPEAATAFISSVRREVREAAPGVPVFKVCTFRQHLDAAPDLWLMRLGATLFSIFGGMALVLAVVGLYAVKAYSVARRTREIGIRMALGADSRNVRGMILREGLVLTLTGAALGLPLAVGLGRLCASMLYGVSALDPLTFTLAPAVLVVTAMLACYLPARKATLVSPLTALRSQ